MQPTGTSIIFIASVPQGDQGSLTSTEGFVDNSKLLNALQSLTGNVDESRDGKPSGLTQFDEMIKKELQLDDRKNVLGEANKNMASADAEIASISESLTKASQDCDKAKDDYTAASKAMELLKSERKVAEQTGAPKATIDFFDQEIKKQEELIAPVLAEVTETTRKKEEQERKLSEAREKRDKCQSEVDSLNLEVTTLSNELNELKKQLGIPVEGKPKGEEDKGGIAQGNKPGQDGIIKPEPKPEPKPGEKPVVDDTTNGGAPFLIAAQAAIKAVIGMFAQGVGLNPFARIGLNTAAQAIGDAGVAAADAGMAAEVNAATNVHQALRAAESRLKGLIGQLKEQLQYLKDYIKDTFVKSISEWNEFMK